MSTKGELLCAQCKARYEICHLLRQETNAEENEKKDLYERLEMLRRTRFAQQEVEQAIADHEVKLKAEFERIQKIQDVEERDAELARMNIVDQVLTLRCPGCKGAFVDFHGCFALTYSRSNCNTSFCTWCLNEPFSCKKHSSEKVLLPPVKLNR